MPLVDLLRELRAGLPLLFRSDRLTVSIIGVGSATESDDTFVFLFGTKVELGEARKVPYDQWKHTRRGRIQRAEMSDRTYAQNVADSVDDVV